MKQRVYLETTIIGYLTTRPSRDLIVAAHQQLTHEWWEYRRRDFDVFVSTPVVEECQAGDPTAAAERLRFLQDLTLLKVTNEDKKFAKVLQKQVPLPKKAAVDALHIAIAVLNGMEFLLTWNCTHIANASLRTRIEALVSDQGYHPPVICTPEELLGERENA